MSYDPPRGVELTVARFVDRKIQILDTSISTSHTVEGVRCNGTQQLSTIPRDLKELDSYLGLLIERQTELNEYVRKVETTLAACRRRFNKSLKVCDDCSGEGGFGRNGSRKDPWRDCEKCNGRGVLPK